MANIIEDFFADQGELPDLGWLIQNGQVTDGELCGILLDDYAPKLSWLAFLLTRSPIEMADVINQTIIQVVYNRKNYRGDVPGRTWLWRLAINECLRLRRVKIDRRTRVDSQILKGFAPEAYFDNHAAEIYNCLGKRNCLLLFFYFGFNLSSDEIAYLLTLPLDQVESDLNGIKGVLAEHQAACPACQFFTGGIHDVVVLLMKAVQSNKPLMDYSSPARARWHASILEQTADLHQHGRTRSYRIQISQAGALLVVLFLSVWLILRQPRQPLPALVIITPTPPVVRKTVPSLLARQQNPNRLPANNTPVPTAPVPDISAILDLARTSVNNWESLWADVEVAQYDPTASSSGEELTRNQVWLGQPLSSRLISGPVNGEPALTISILNNRLTSENFENGQTVHTFTSVFIPDPNLQKLFTPQFMLDSSGSYHYVGSDRIAGRPVWILDHYDGTNLTDTIAIDSHYGVILYRREYGGKDRKTILMDTNVTSIAYNPQISPSIYMAEMYLGDHYAVDFSGTPDIYNVQNALAVWTSPASFNLAGRQPTSVPVNPSSSELTFLNPANLEASAGLDLFANGRFLGQLPVGGSAIMTCKRSPDGSKIAYNSEGLGATGDTALYISSLSSIQTTYRVMPNGFSAGDYAFSPDGKQLAFFGCSKANGFCGLMLLDTETGKVTPLVQLKYADYMIWKPDGRYLALVGVEDNSAAMAKINNQNLLLNEVMAISRVWQYYVFDIRSGDTVFKQVFQWSLLRAPADSPTNSWNVPLKDQLGGVDGCTNPPSYK